LGAGASIFSQRSKTAVRSTDFGSIFPVDIFEGVRTIFCFSKHLPQNPMPQSCKSRNASAAAAAAAGGMAGLVAALQNKNQKIWLLKRS